MASKLFKNGFHKITQKYSASHKAVDLVGNSTIEPIIAHADGTVVFCQTGQKNNKGSTGNASYGNCIKLKHANGYYTLYAHLDRVDVKLNQVVKKGQTIGTMGNTGNSYGAHLHFEVRKDANTHIDPTPYLENDLPKADVPVNIKYQVIAQNAKTWYSIVTNYNDKNANGYAGVPNKPIVGFRATATTGLLEYRAHYNGKWGAWTSGMVKFAGDGKTPIDAIQCRLSGAGNKKVYYRVSSINNNKYYNWCANSTDVTGDGYAGVFKKNIDLIQMYAK